MDAIDLKYAKSILIRLSEKDISKKIDLSNIIKSHQVLDNLLSHLESDGYISVNEKKIGHKTYSIALTQKGRKVAEQLKRADLLAQGKEEAPLDMPHDFMDEFHNLGAMTHFNVKDDHIAVQEYNFDGQGNNRIVYVYTKPNGHNIMRLWCDVDQSWDCKHTKFAWTLPDVQELMERLFRDMPAKKDDQNI